MTLPACNAEGDFDPYEIGPTVTEAGERTKETAENADKTLDDNPAVDASFPEARRGVGLMRLGGELLLLIGGVLTWRKKKEAEDLLSEVDANPQTPSVENQASTVKAKKVARKLAG